MAQQNNTYNQNSGKMFENINNVNIKNDFKREYRDLKDFYLDDDKKDQLKSMGKFKRFFFQAGYLFSSIFQKLTPFRKILVVLGVVLLFLARTSGTGNDGGSSNTALIGGLLIFFVLVLELKDKLVATEELIAGKNIQRALMPVESPEIDGWDIFLYTSSANEVSGDLVDYLKLGEDKAAITIADVAGKGLSAALLTAKLQATIRAFADTVGNTAQLAEKTNKIFNRDSLPNIFASMIYIEFNPSNNILSFTNAGHLPPVILREDGLTELPKGDAALGLLQKGAYKNNSAELKENEMFIVYSDGITEAQNDMGMFYGKERFLQVLKNGKNKTASELGYMIVSSVRLFRGEAKMSDDLSLVIIKKK